MLPQQYKKRCISLVLYLDNIDYPDDATFLQDQLTDITPTDIKFYSLFQIHGNVDIFLENNKKPKHRCTSVLNGKNFMPNNNNAWVETAKIDNLTCSTAIAHIIKHLKNKEMARIMGPHCKQEGSSLKTDFVKLSAILKPI